MWTDPPYVVREIAFFRPYLLYVFGTCALLCWPIEILRIIIESVDHPEKVSKIIGAPKGLRHTWKMRYAEKVHFFRTPWLNVFGRLDLISRPTEMIHTILELGDYHI